MVSSQKSTARSPFHLENIKEKEELIKFYTGFQDYATLFAFYKTMLESDVLIGITPNGVMSFVSKCYEGSISERKLVELSRLLEKLEPGDEIMADKGFQIQDLLAPLGVRLNVPPFLAGNTQMSEIDVIHTKKIAQLRVHVERAIG